MNNSKIYHPSYHWCPLAGSKVGLIHYFVYYIHKGRQFGEVGTTSIMASSHEEAIEVITTELPREDIICADSVEI